MYRLISDSDDGLGTREQTRLVNSDRERWSMQRLATVVQVQVRDEVIEARRIQDQATAAALRDHVFDYHGPPYEGIARTNWRTFGNEVGDVVTIEHDVAPGGSIEEETVE